MVPVFSKKISYAGFLFHSAAQVTSCAARLGHQKAAPPYVESISASSPVKRLVLPMLAISRAARGSGPGCAAFDSLRASNRIES
jgi:hypothetical protein